MYDVIVCGIVCSGMCLGAPLGSIPFRCVDIVGGIRCILDLFVGTGTERKALVSSLWCAHAGVGRDRARSTGIKTASSYRKDGIVWRVRSYARVVCGAIPLVVGAQIPCVLRTVTVCLKPLALCPCLFRMGVVPCRHVYELRADPLKRVADGPKEDGFIPALSYCSFVDGKGCIAGVETIHRFPLPCFLTGYKKVWPTSGSSGVVFTCMRKPLEPLCHAILLLRAQDGIVVPLPARLYNRQAVVVLCFVRAHFVSVCPVPPEEAGVAFCTGSTICGTAVAPWMQAKLVPVNVHDASS